MALAIWEFARTTYETDLISDEKIKAIALLQLKRSDLKNLAINELVEKNDRYLGSPAAVVSISFSIEMSEAKVTPPFP